MAPHTITDVNASTFKGSTFDNTALLRVTRNTCA